MLARTAFASVRTAFAGRARFAHTQASGQAAGQALTIQKMSMAEWSEAFKKVCAAAARADAGGGAGALGRLCFVYDL